MKKLFFETEKDGFYGTYYENPKGSDCAVIGMFGDDPNDYMAKCGTKWLHKNGVNVLCMSPGKKNYSHVNFPLERIETAIQWLKNNGNQKTNQFKRNSYSSGRQIHLTPCSHVWLTRQCHHQNHTFSRGR